MGKVASSLSFDGELQVKEHMSDLAGIYGLLYMLQYLGSFVDCMSTLHWQHRSYSGDQLSHRIHSKKLINLKCRKSPMGHAALTSSCRRVEFLAPSESVALMLSWYDMSKPREGIPVSFIAPPDASMLSQEGRMPPPWMAADRVRLPYGLFS